jgi:threonine/homoserine/homoserine lactone efflux protein
MSLFHLLAVHLAALASPGPDNLLVLSFAKGNIKRSFYLASGLSSGILIHSLIVVFGLGQWIIDHPSVFTSIQALGASYLLYICYQLFRASFQNLSQDISASKEATARELYKKAFITFLLNPKALLYFFSILPQFLDPNASTARLSLIVFLIVLESFLWFFGFGILLGFSKKIMRAIEHPYYLRAVASLFGLFSISIFYSLL